MVGGLLFAGLASKSFGQNAKQWRLFADAINNVGITIEVLAPAVSARRPLFLLCLSIASICRALCGVAAGATNAAISEHFGSKRGNIAEVASKNGAQHTAVSLFCLLISVPFIRLTGSANPLAMWAIYSSLTLTHMASNIMAMRALALRSLNLNRLSILCARFLRLQPALGANNESLLRAELSAAAVAKADSLLLWSRPRDARPLAGISILYWASLQSLLAVCAPDTIRQCAALYENCPYLLVPSRDAKTIVVCIKQSATTAAAAAAAAAGSGQGTAKALFEAHVLRQSMAHQSPLEPEPEHASTALKARAQTDALWPSFWSALAGLEWDTQRLLLQPPRASTLSVTFVA